MVHKKTIIAATIAEIRGNKTDKEFAEALGEFTQGELHPSPTTIQKYRTGQRQPSYADFSRILDYGRKNDLISPITGQRLADFFHLTELRGDFVKLQQELFVLQAQLAESQEQVVSSEDKYLEDSLPKNNISGNSATLGKDNPSAHAPASKSKLGKQLGDVLNIPILVEIPFTYPHKIDENCEGFVTMPRSMLSGSDYFFLKIFGDAMNNAGINDGDLVLVRRTESAEDGQTVIARLNGVELCKKYFRTGVGIILLPADHNFEPVQSGNFQLIGVVEKVTRNL
ncbi:MAG: LexA family protein [Desulfitobacteriaceae bacterium]